MNTWFFFTSSMKGEKGIKYVIFSHHPLKDDVIVIFSHLPWKDDLIRDFFTSSMKGWCDMWLIRDFFTSPMKGEVKYMVFHIINEKMMWYVIYCFTSSMEGWCDTWFLRDFFVSSMKGEVKHALFFHIIHESRG